ncbi:MAG: hypothetical protein IJI43_01340 [Bacilli bacterium]|nr:hypothetical protein [Bacilli bacterium]
MNNTEIIKYIEEKFSDTDIDVNEKAAILEEYLNSPKSPQEIKNSIDAKYNELTNSNNLSSNTDILTNIGLNTKIINQKDNEVEAAIDLKDMDDLRTNLKSTKYYDSNTDSMTFSKDGNDYGLQITTDYKTNINFTPILKSKDKIYLYEWNKNTNTFTIKSTENNLVDENTNFITINERHITDMNNISKSEMLKNSLIRYSYINSSRGKKINDYKLGEALTRLKDKSSYEVNELLSKSLYKKKVNTKQLGYTKTISLGLILTIFGIIICLIAILIK